MYKTLFLLFAFSLVFIGCKKRGCKDPNAINFDPKAKLTDGSCEFLNVGDSYQGGIIFYLDGNGGGLIAAPTDQSSGAEWGCRSVEIAGADGVAVGTGNQNTIDIEAGCPSAVTAAGICADLTLGGYSDWFLPSVDELQLMFYYLHQQLDGEFTDTFYLSSTESDSFYAKGVSFNWGVQGSFAKSALAYVRAVRAF